MIHYNVWFSFRAGVDEADALPHARAFLATAKARNLTHDFTLLKNPAQPGAGRLPPFHALGLFRDETQFAEAFQDIGQGGFRRGLHGEMIQRVQEFVVEAFDEIEPPSGVDPSTGDGA